MIDSSSCACALSPLGWQGDGAFRSPCKGIIASAADDTLSSGRTRIIAALMALVIAFSVSVSSFTVAGDLHHHHTGDGCVVCAQISGCLHMARVGATLVADAAALVIVRALTCPLILGEERGRHACSTLVHLKVQLND